MGAAWRRQLDNVLNLEWKAPSAARECLEAGELADSALGLEGTARPKSAKAMVLGVLGRGGSTEIVLEGSGRRRIDQATALKRFWRRGIDKDIVLQGSGSRRIKNTSVLEGFKRRWIDKSDSLEGSGSRQIC